MAIDVRVIDEPHVPGARWEHTEAIVVSSTAVSLPQRTYDIHERADIFVETAAIRFRLDGDDPTATAGLTGLVNDIIKLENGFELAGFRVIQRDAADATIRISYGTRI